MKPMVKAIKWIVIGLVFLITGFVLFVFVRADRTYDAPYPEITASQDSALIARGRHLFYSSAHCSGCRAPRSEMARLEMGEEVVPSGGEDFSLPIGMIYAFKTYARACMKSTLEKDSGTLQYDWFLNSDQSECVVREKYKDSNAVLEHIGNLGDLFGQLLSVSDGRV